MIREVLSGRSIGAVSGLVLWIAFVLNVAPACALPPGKHYEVLQLNDNIKRVQFDAKSLRIACLNGVVIVSRAPDWNVCMFNTSSRRMYRTTEKYFRDRWVSFPASAMPVLPPASERRLKLSSLNEFKVVTMTCPVNVELPMAATEIFFASDKTRAKKSTFIDQYVYSVCEGDFPPQVCHILQDLYRVPVDDRFPLHFLRHIKDSKIFRMGLRTNSFKIVDGKVDAKEPVAYQVCKDPESVFFDSTARQTVESGVDVLLGEPKVSK